MCPPPPLAGANLRRTLRGYWRRLWVVWVGLVSTAGLSPGEVCTAARPAGSPAGVGWGCCRAFREEAARGCPQAALLAALGSSVPVPSPPDSGPFPLLTLAADPQAPAPPGTPFPEPQSLPIYTPGMGPLLERHPAEQTPVLEAGVVLDASGSAPSPPQPGPLRAPRPPPTGHPQARPGLASGLPCVGQSDL